MYNALTEAFAIPGPRNATAVAEALAESKRKFKVRFPSFFLPVPVLICYVQDIGLLGNFIENHDVPRWSNQSVDPQSMYNAMTFNFMTDGIPIVYYGQEQFFHGVGDPVSVQALLEPDSAFILFLVQP